MADSKELIRRHFEEVWSQGKFDGMDQLYDSGYQGEVPLVGKVDRNGLKSVVLAYRKAFPDLKFNVQSIIQEGDTAAVRWIASGTSKGEFMGIPATGTYGTVQGLSVIDLKNGMIARDIAEMDLVAFFRQMGLQMPVQPGAGVQPGAPAT